MNIKNIKLSLLIFAGLVIASFGVFAVAQENQSSDKNIFLDSDQDGLSDTEEKTYGTDPLKSDTDGDGYGDGVEVKSGYNPLIHSPGDKIVDESKQSVTASAQDRTSSGKKEENTKELTTISQKQNTAGGELKTESGNGLADNTEISDENSEEKNLTKEVTAKLIELIDNNNQEGKEISITDIDALIQQSMSGGVTLDDLPVIDEKTIKIKEEDYSKLSEAEKKAKEKENVLEYLTSVAYVAINNAPQKISEPDDLEEISNQLVSQVTTFSPLSPNLSYFNDYAERGQKVLDQMKEIEVPEKFVPLQVKGLQLASYAVSLKDKVKMKPDDPLGSMTEISKVQNLIGLTMNYSAEISSYLKKLGITEIPLNL